TGAASRAEAARTREDTGVRSGARTAAVGRELSVAPAAEWTVPACLEEPFLPAQSGLRADPAAESATLEQHLRLARSALPPRVGGRPAPGRVWRLRGRATGGRLSRCKRSGRGGAGSAPPPHQRTLAQKSRWG